MRKFVKWLIPASVLVTTVLLFRFVFFIGYVSTESMEPTIHKGSYILGCRIFGELKVGDIIVFEYEGKQIVKRVAAVGGDVVNHMGCNLTVPEECFYVLGDNGDNSWDSRCCGTGSLRGSPLPAGAVLWSGSPLGKMRSLPSTSPIPATARATT